uniref:Proline rich 5 n=1 Tax=Bos taurus TaxID=9913 RepID=A0A3Q1LZK5_BOVIN
PGQERAGRRHRRGRAGHAAAPGLRQRHLGQHPQRGDCRLPAQGAARPGAFQPERRCPAAAEDGAGVLLHGVPTEPAADERHGDPARQDPLLRGDRARSHSWPLCPRRPSARRGRRLTGPRALEGQARTEAAGLAGGDLGLLLQRRAAHPAGGLLPRAGERPGPGGGRASALRGPPAPAHAASSRDGRKAAASPGPQEDLRNAQYPTRRRVSVCDGHPSLFRGSHVGPSLLGTRGKEPSVRQLALLHFRNTITLGVKLEDALARAHARVPPAIVQMLLVLQGVHESRGVTKDYLRLETLIQKVVSPYLGTYGLYSGEGAFTHSCILEKHYLRRSRSGDVLAKNPVVRSKSYNTPLLNPVAEHEAEGAAAGGAGVRRHSVSEMTSCPEPQGFADTPGPGPAGAFGTSPSSPPSGPCANRLYPPAQPPKPGPGAARGSPASSSPENLVDQILESVDSDSEGIFIDFGRGGGSGTSEFDGAGGRQSVV